MIGIIWNIRILLRIFYHSSFVICNTDMILIRQLVYLCNLHYYATDHEAFCGSFFNNNRTYCFYFAKEMNDICLPPLESIQLGHSARDGRAMIRVHW